MEDDLKGVYINDTTYKVRSKFFSHMQLESFSFWLEITKNSPIKNQIQDLLYSIHCKA